MQNRDLLEKLQALLKRKQSKKYYASQLNITESEVEQLMNELKNKENIEDLQDFEQKVVETEFDHKTGGKKIVIRSDKPLSPKEIEKLVGVDNISTFVDKSWLKSQKDGTWTYSILVTCKIKDFYTSKELDAKLKEIFVNSKSSPIKGIKFPKYKTNNEYESLFIYIADDHAGINITDSLYNKEYSGLTYVQRLLKIVKEVKSLNKTFEKVYIIRLGDELDGFNGKTTRYDHDLGSLSNKEQFDIYTTSNKLFYDELFTSNIASEYTIRNLLNSNHSGNGFSYIANKALEFWISAKFSNVEIQYQEKFIDIIEYGNHIIGTCHGKDSKHMNTPMPLNLDYRTDLWLMDYFKQYQQTGRFISLLKGDLHKYSINMGKFGRYFNVPSIANASNWVEHNFGDSKAGAIIEIYKKDSENIQTIPIWF